MKKITSFDDACKALGISNALPDVSALPEKQRKAIVAHYQLVIIAEALNEGWKPNWNDWNEWKYYPWFKMGKEGASPGVGFSYSAYVNVHTFSGVGSRLCFKSSKLAEYAGEKFEQLYKDYFLIE